MNHLCRSRRGSAVVGLISFTLILIAGLPSEGTEHNRSSDEAVGHLSSEMSAELESVIVPSVKIVDATPQAVIEYIEGLLPQSIETVTRPSIQAFQKRGFGRYSVELHDETVKHVIDDLMRLIGCSYSFSGASHFCVRLADVAIAGQSSITNNAQNGIKASAEDVIDFE